MVQIARRGYRPSDDGKVVELNIFRSLVSDDVIFGYFREPSDIGNTAGAFSGSAAGVAVAQAFRDALAYAERRCIPLLLVNDPDQLCPFLDPGQLQAILVEQPFSAAAAGYVSAHDSAERAPSPWLRLVVEQDAAKRAILARFQEASAHHGHRLDAAVFVRDSDDRRSSEVFLTPQAADWADEVVPGGAWLTCEPPVRDLVTSFLVGDRRAVDLLHPREPAPARLAATVT